MVSPVSSRTDRRIGVVILNWKRPQDTLACLASLDRVKAETLDVVVVNNGPRDHLAETIHERFPSVGLIENERNLGFAGGCNVGIRHLLDRGADYVMLHNDDAEVAPDTFQILADHADADSTIGMIGPTIYYGRERDIVWSAGGRIDGLGRPGHPNADGPLPGDLPELCDVDYMTGCVLLVKRSVIERVGLLDERFFAYFEEAEWCARARRAGFRVTYAPRACAWHQIESDARGQSPLYVYLMARNRLLYLRATGAPLYVLVAAIADTLRTSASWSCRRRHRHQRPFASLLRRAVWDFISGHVGAPPAILAAAQG
jgi:GT2 family glycosyltransferase